jgi:hypothetical protein
MRFSRIALAILALPFAWRWGPALLDWSVRVSPPAIAGAFTFLTPDFSGKGLTFFFKFLIGLPSSAYVPCLLNVRMVWVLPFWP